MFTAVASLFAAIVGAGVSMYVSSKRDCLVFTCVDENYEAYVPMWNVCNLRTYWQQSDSHVHIVSSKGKVPHYAACLRFLIDPCKLLGVDYKYIYTTDVDMFHLPVGDLFWYHMKKMEKTGLSYSNTPRRMENRGAERLTGLHFCTKEWYNQTRVAREKYLKLLEAGEIGKEPIDDELTLMKICVESRLKIPPKEQLIPRHFGVHAGSFRDKDVRIDQPEIDKRMTYDRVIAWNVFSKTSAYNDTLAEVCKKSEKIGETIKKITYYCRRALP
jgi:hypothetical protein